MKTCRKCSSEFAGKYCVVCDRARSAARYAANKEEYKQRSAAYHAKNKETISLRSAAYRAEHSEILRIKSKAYYQANADSIKSRMAEYRAANPEKIFVYSSVYYKNNANKIIKKSSVWRVENPERAAARLAAWQKANSFKCNTYNAKRKALKISATPAWANLEKIYGIYESSVLTSRETGVVHQVDHIVPLQSDIVCGLHVEHNLRVITAYDNLSKSNRHWPDMP